VARARWIAVVGGLGYAPIAPGTFGSLLGVLLFVAAARVAGHAGVGPLAAVSTATGDSGATVGSDGAVMGAIVGLGYLAAVMVMLLVGVWASRVSERAFGTKDDGRIVIDEVVGQLIALMPLLFASGLASASAAAPGNAPLRLGMTANSFSFFCWVVTGFVLFRLFDITKPSAVRWAERRFEGGLGVMMDDVVAGVFAAITLVALHTALRMTGIDGLSGIPGLTQGLEVAGVGSGDGSAWLGGRR